MVREKRGKEGGEESGRGRVGRKSFADEAKKWRAQERLREKAAEDEGEERGRVRG